MDQEQVYRKLIGELRGFGSVVVAYSGGIDSALVLKLATDALGDRALGATARSPSVPESELVHARRFAETIGARHVVIDTRELEDERYALNPANRCYYCKSELYTRLAELARREGFAAIANGTNLDDVGDYRPGLQAADEFKVVSPLRDAGLRKADVRALARHLELEVWDKPASPCLSSRIPYGSVVTIGKLKSIEQAEAHLQSLGFREVRVRHFGSKARIEVPAAERAALDGAMPGVSERLRELGFETCETADFRSGSLNDALKRDV